MDTQFSGLTIPSPKIQILGFNETAKEKQLYISMLCIRKSFLGRMTQQVILTRVSLSDSFSSGVACMRDLDWNSELDVNRCLEDLTSHAEVNPRYTLAVFEISKHIMLSHYILKELPALSDLRLLYALSLIILICVQNDVKVFHNKREGLILDLLNSNHISPFSVKVLFRGKKFEIRILRYYFIPL